MGTAAELWEFADPQSEVSKRLEASLKVVLQYGARITYVGSMDDQLVPLEVCAPFLVAADDVLTTCQSAIYAPAHHPYIYRSVFIDGRIHAPDFIAHLIGFALKLRNLGVNDHGLVRELSAPLAGSLYSGEGHSRLYDEPQVYEYVPFPLIPSPKTDNPAPASLSRTPSRQQTSAPSPARCISGSRTTPTRTTSRGSCAGCSRRTLCAPS